jgi:hypothetical protein
MSRDGLEPVDTSAETIENLKCEAKTITVLRIINSLAKETSPVTLSIGTTLKGFVHHDCIVVKDAAPYVVNELVSQLMEYKNVDTSLNAEVGGLLINIREVH